MMQNVTLYTWLRAACCCGGFHLKSIQDTGVYSKTLDGYLIKVTLQNRATPIYYVRKKSYGCCPRDLTIIEDSLEWETAASNSFVLKKFTLLWKLPGQDPCYRTAECIRLY